MRAFVILCYVALCAADVSELMDDGYNYPQPSGMDSSGADGYNHEKMAHEVDYNSASSLEPGFQRPGFDGDLHAGPVATVSKRFFTVTAMDNDHDDDDDAYESGAEHKNYDIVFAKAPTPSVKSALRAFSNYAGQQQTAVYVLSKKLGADEIGHALRASGIKPSRPEVHFIKYKTPDEAAYAQKQVRAKYDAFGGHNEFAGEQTAPVHSVVGSLGHYGRRPSAGSHGHRGHDHRDYQTGLKPQPFAPKRYLPPRY